MLVASSSVATGTPFIQLVSPEALSEAPVSQDTIQNHLIPFYAALYGVPETTLTAVISCESSFRQGAVGDNGHARGLVQINDNFHPEIAAYEAFNASFAINFLAYNISIGEGNQWTCYRKIGYGGSGV